MRKLLIVLLMMNINQAMAFTRVFESVPIHWARSSDGSITIPWTVEKSAPPATRAAMIAATQQWMLKTRNTIIFREGTGGLIVEGSKNPVVFPLYTMLAVTTFNFQPRVGTIHSSKIILNIEGYRWTRAGKSTVSHAGSQTPTVHLDSVLLHELGHVIGLGHSNDHPERIVGAKKDPPTMNSIAFPGQRTLHTDDVAGVFSLYEPTWQLDWTPPFSIQVDKIFKKRGDYFLSLSMQGLMDSSATWSVEGQAASYPSNVKINYYLPAPGSYVVHLESNGYEALKTVVVDP